MKFRILMAMPVLLNTGLVIRHDGIKWNELEIGRQLTVSKKIEYVWEQDV